MAFRLTLHDVRFVDLLTDEAGHVVTAAQHLAEVLAGDQTSRVEAAQRLQAVDQEVDRAAHTVLRTLSATFVTPFDRADVYQVSWSLRRCVARMDAVADEIVLFQLGELPPGVSELVRLTVRAADVTREAVRSLARPEAITDPWIELVRFAKQAGRAHRQLLTSVTSTVTD
ncbi:MAG: DUF47 family protein, partial [Kineosporiaceae bacterium]